MPKIKTSFTLSNEAILLLKKLACKYGRSSANTLELLIRELAKKEKIKAD